ncbi:MAG: helix-turn-helix transcriptional regulator [Oscillospiraceae bacterium]|nr:helix-turn-helix transcriptional regulator [Oscillospiraceae bacterium]
MTKMASERTSKDDSSFGDYVKERREALGKSIRGLAVELDMTPAYLSDIEKGNRYAPEKHLTKMVEVLQITGESLDCFYDLAGKSRNDIFPDLTPYIGEKSLARVALRKARDLNISDEKWQEIIDSMNGNSET